MLEPPATVLPLSVRSLDISHDGRKLLELDSFYIEAGELCCIVGPNGAGKSLLLKAMAGLQASEGQILWAGKQPSREGYHKLGMLLQAPVLLRRSVSANIHFALKVQTQLNARQRKQAVDDALDLANMQHLRHASARVLSGGERQRLALVRALACKPELLLLDEPASSMDPASTAWLEKTLLDAHQRGLSIVLVTHDLHQARRLATRVVLMHRGAIIEDREKNQFFDHPISTEARAFVGGELLF